MKRAAAALIGLMVVGKLRAEDPPPAPPRAVHENKVSVEAKALMDKYAKLLYLPGDHGLKTATASLIADDVEKPKPIRFEFTAPGPAYVLLDPSVKKDDPKARKFAVVFYNTPFRVAYGGVPIVETSEYDAEVVDRGGERLLLVKEIREGRSSEVNEVRFDAAGLVASVKRGPSAVADKPVDLGVEMLFTWTKTGDQYRVEKMETASFKGAERVGVMRYGLTWKTIDGIDIVTGLSTTIQAPDGKSVTNTFHVEDLVVNGKPVDLKALATTPPSNTDTPPVAKPPAPDGDSQK